MVNLVILRLKQLYTNKAILVLAMVITLLFAALVSGIYEEVNQERVLTVGVLDLDQTDFSKHVMANVADNPLFEQFEVTLEVGIERLKSNEFELMYVINQGAFEQVLREDYEALISLYYIGDNYLSPLLGDVLVGEMFEVISMEASMNMLSMATGSFENQEALKSEAIAYSKVLSASIEAGSYVDVTFFSLEQEQVIDESVINTNLIYKQMLIGIVLAFVGFYILFCGTAIVRDVELGMMNKIGITKTKDLAVTLGNFISIWLGALPIFVVFSVINGIYSGDFLGTVLSYFMLYSIYGLVASSATLMLALLVKNVASYVVIGSAYVLILGVVSGSFFNIDLTIDVIRRIASWTYPYYALNNLMDLVLFNRLYTLADYLLSMMGFSLIFLVIAYIMHKKSIRN